MKCIKGDRSGNVNWVKVSRRKFRSEHYMRSRTLWLKHNTSKCHLCYTLVKIMLKFRTACESQKTKFLNADSRSDTYWNENWKNSSLFCPLKLSSPYKCQGNEPLLVHSPLESFKLVDKPKPNVGWLKQSSTQWHSSHHNYLKTP